MCGIFTLLNYTEHFNDENIIKTEFMKGQKRGPEFSKLDSSLNKNIIFGFHRLAINGLNIESNQPFLIDNIMLICNGEIYNYKELYRSMNIIPKTDSDCEVIIYLYQKYGIEHALKMLDGVFAFILCDIKDKKLFVARDPMGVRPLYNLNSVDEQSYIGFASELKCLSYFKKDTFGITHFSPGTYSIYKLEEIFDDVNMKTIPIWKNEIERKPYYLPSISYSTIYFSSAIEFVEVSKNLAYYLNSAVLKRCITTERPVACLLSGGLDSSLIAALAANYFRVKGKKIETYSIGLAESEDIKYARIVASYIGSKHTEIIVTEDDMFNAIPEVIEALESYDTTTVRASLGNYLIGKYIASNSEAKVIFNGDGSDELFGGYLYMNKCPDDIEFDKETRRLLNDIHLFDVLRSDKSISSNGLEPRTPFLDRTFVNYILSVPPQFRNHNNLLKMPEKYLLRRAFSDYFEDSLGRQILPDEILWRRKEAFSDGVSSQGRSLFIILQEKIGLKKGVEPSIELEKIYYKEIFDNLYPNCSSILPYYWMPKYTNATDPSARTLEIYK